MAAKKPLAFYGGRLKELAVGDSVSWSLLSATPTTLAGYGITDAVDTVNAQSIGGIKTFRSALVVNPTAGAAQAILRAPAAATADLVFAQDADNKWLLRKHNDASQDLLFYKYDDAGAATISARWNRLTGILNFVDGAPTVGAVPLVLNNRTITAGNGMTGGGDLSANRTLTLGTPATLSGSTSNAVTSTSHTHAITLKYSPADGTTEATSYPSENPITSSITAATGWPNNNGTALTVHADTSANRVFQLFSPASGGTGTPDLYLRASHSSQNGGGWTSFYKLWHEGNDGAGSGLDADTLDGFPSTVGVFADTVPVRTGAGDIYARLFRSTYPNQTTISGAISFRTDDTTDNFIRFCDSPAAVRAWTGAASLATAETITGQKTFAPGGGGFPSLSASFNTLIVGDRPAADGIAAILLNPLGVQGGMGIRYSNAADNFTIHDWGTASAPQRWAIDRLTGNVTQTGGLSFGSAVAPGGDTDLSRHIALYSTTYGLSITSQSLNIVAPSTALVKMNLGGTIGLSVSNAAWYGAGKEAVRISDSWLRLNPAGDFTTGIYTATSLVRSDGTFQVGTTTTNGFHVSTTTAPKWKDIELGYRSVPLTTQNATYTFVADDAGKGRLHSNTTAYNYTVPSAVFAAGDVLTVASSSTGVTTLVQGAGMTLRLAGTATTGNRTVAAYGLATIFFVSSSVALVSGPGVS